MLINHRSGHPYTITECGYPMEEADCPVEGCNQRIGGSRYRLLSSNRFINQLVTKSFGEKTYIRHI